MESFLVSVVIFVVLAATLGIWRHLTKKSYARSVAQLDQQIAEVAEVAQRRHQQRFGRASTDLNKSFNGTITQRHVQSAQQKS